MALPFCRLPPQNCHKVVITAFHAIKVSHGENVSPHIILGPCSAAGSPPTLAGEARERARRDDCPSTLHQPSCAKKEFSSGTIQSNICDGLRSRSPSIIPCPRRGSGSEGREGGQRRETGGRGRALLTEHEDGCARQATAVV